jgi:hypothetical protein
MNIFRAQPGHETSTPPWSAVLSFVRMQPLLVGSSKTCGQQQVRLAVLSFAVGSEEGSLLILLGMITRATKSRYMMLFFDVRSFRYRFYSVEVSQALVARLTRVRFTVGPLLLPFVVLNTQLRLQLFCST